MLIFSILLFLLSIYIFLSYFYEWEHSKKHWQKGIPYSRYDKILGIAMASILFILSLFIFMKTF
jgi:hypothetical protein